MSQVREAEWLESPRVQFQRVLDGLVGRPCAGVLRAANGIELFFESARELDGWKVFDGLEIACRWQLEREGRVVTDSQRIPVASAGAGWPLPPLFPELTQLEERTVRGVRVGVPVHDLEVDFGDGFVLRATCVPGSPWIDWAVVTHDALWLVSGEVFGPG